MSADESAKEKLFAIGALGSPFGDSYPAYVEAIVVNESRTERFALMGSGYGYPEFWDPSEVCMVPLPKPIEADPHRHVLLLGPEDLKDLAHVKGLSSFMYVLPEESEKILLALCDVLVTHPMDEHNAWRLQRAARGRAKYMVIAAKAFDDMGRPDFANLMRRATSIG